MVSFYYTSDIMDYKFIESGDTQIRIPIPQNYKDIIVLIQSDQYRLHSSFVSLRKILYLLLRGDLLAWFRICSIKDKLSPIKDRIYYRIARKRQVDLVLGTAIGYGFNLGHCMCSVINEKTIIGNNVNISQFVNIGQNHGKGAIIGDGVYIAPMVCLVEEVVIGRSSIIGAGAVVVKDVPPLCIMGGGTCKDYQERHIS